MITITVVNRAQSEQESEDFLKSLSYSHVGDPSYEVSDEPSSDSVIQIFLPNDCLVLGNAWNQYVQYAISNGLPQYGRGKNYVPNWENYVQSKMGLQTRRPPEGIFPDLKVVLASQ